MVIPIALLLFRELLGIIELSVQGEAGDHQLSGARQLRYIFRNHEITLDDNLIFHYHMVVDSLSKTFSALSDPTRREMISVLSRGPASVHQLTEPFALSQQMISKHIAYLVRARIVTKTKRGRESICTLRPQAIKTISDWAISYRQLWEERFDKLDAVVAQMKEAEVRHDKKRRE